MKKINNIVVFLVTGALVLMAALQGCKTVNGKQQVDADRVAMILGQAAQLGTSYYLRAHPDQRQPFVLAEQALTRLVDTQNYDPVAFSDALQRLPVNELSGPNGSLYVSAAIVAWDQVAASATTLDKNELVKKSLIAVTAGLHKALAPPLAPPTPPSSTPLPK